MNRPAEFAFLILIVLFWGAFNADIALAEGRVLPAEEAAAISVVAHSKSASRDYTLCADLYHQAYALDPKFIGYLYSAARCEQKGGLLDRAEKHYRVVLQRSPEETSIARRAGEHLREIMEIRKATPLPQMEERPVEVAQPVSPPEFPKPNLSARWGWSLLTVAAVASLGGGWVVEKGYENKGILEEKLSNLSQGYIVGLTRDQALADEREYRSQYGVGGVLIGVGVTSLVLGGWCLKKGVVPLGLFATPGGAIVQGTFAW